MAVLPKLIYRSMQSLSKPQQAFFEKLKADPKFSRKRTRIAKTITKMNIPDFKTYYKTTVIKTV